MKILDYTTMNMINWCKYGSMLSRFIHSQYVNFGSVDFNAKFAERVKEIEQ